MQQILMCMSCGAKYEDLTTRRCKKEDCISSLKKITVLYATKKTPSAKEWREYVKEE